MHDAWMWFSVSICVTLLGHPLTFSGMLVGMTSHMNGILVPRSTGRVQAVHHGLETVCSNVGSLFCMLIMFPMKLGETGFGMATLWSKWWAGPGHECRDMLALEGLQRQDIFGTGSRIVVKPLQGVCEFHVSGSRMKSPENNLLHRQFLAKFVCVTPCALNDRFRICVYCAVLEWAMRDWRWWV